MDRNGFARTGDDGRWGAFRLSGDPVCRLPGDMHVNLCGSLPHLRAGLYLQFLRRILRGLDLRPVLEATMKLLPWVLLVAFWPLASLVSRWRGRMELKVVFLSLAFGFVMLAVFRPELRWPSLLFTLVALSEGLRMGPRPTERHWTGYGRSPVPGLAGAGSPEEMIRCTGGVLRLGWPAGV